MSRRKSSRKRKKVMPWPEPGVREIKFVGTPPVVIVDPEIKKMTMKYFAESWQEDMLRWATEKLEIEEPMPTPPEKVPESPMEDPPVFWVLIQKELGLWVEPVTQEFEQGKAAAEEAAQEKADLEAAMAQAWKDYRGAIQDGMPAAAELYKQRARDLTERIKNLAEKPDWIPDWIKERIAQIEAQKMLAEEKAAMERAIEAARKAMGTNPWDVPNPGRPFIPAEPPKKVKAPEPFKPKPGFLEGLVRSQKIWFIDLIYKDGRRQKLKMTKEPYRMLQMPQLAMRPFVAFGSLIHGDTFQHSEQVHVDEAVFQKSAGKPRKIGPNWVSMVYNQC